jgi:hypothetical protein
MNFEIKICVVFSNHESNLVKEIMDPYFVISFFYVSNFVLKANVLLVCTYSKLVFQILILCLFAEFIFTY